MVGIKNLNRFLACAVSGVLISATTFLAAAPASADDGKGRDPSPAVKLTKADRKLLAAEATGRELGALVEAGKALGVYADAGSGEYVLRVEAAGAAKRVTSADLRAAGVRGARVAPSRYSRATVERLDAQIKERTWHPAAAKYAYAYHYDARQDAVVVSTDAPADVAGSLEAAGAVVKREAATRRDSRANDGPPHWGGASITDGGSVCSSGFSVQNSAATRFMVTAAHCFGLGAAVRSTGGGGSFGTVTSRGPFPTWDLALLGGASYGSYIYTGGSTGVPSHVLGAGDPAINFTGYCRSGQTTFEHCGHTVTSLSGSFCDASGCTPGLIVYSGGGTSAGGDSGAPFYLPGSGGVWIRGVHIARSGTTMYAEKWSTVAAHFGVSIVT